MKNPLPFGKTEQVKDFFTSLFPPMEREDRIELLDRITEGSQLSRDYIVMMILSSALASLGLLQSSTAVVIGAMLVAPLMGPLIGAGMAITQGNAKLFRISMGGVIAGIAIGLFVSVFIGLLNPGFEPTLEIEARGEPDAMDLGIAFLSGFFAAYALTNIKLASSIAGVAIAAALVPPLAVVGVAFMIGLPVISLNASLLLATNVVAIIIGAAAAFRVLGLHKSIQADNKPTWIKRALVLFALITLLLLIPLELKLISKKKTGQNRPLTLPVAKHTREVVDEFLSQYPDIELLLIGRNSVEPDSEVVVISAGYDEVEKSLSTDLRSAIRKSRGAKIPVKIMLLQGKRLDTDK